LRLVRLYVETRGEAETVEADKLWLDPAVPFAIVRQKAKVIKNDGTVMKELEMQLQDTGLTQLTAKAAARSMACASIRW
jgi:hypothetical protein